MMRRRSFLSDDARASRCRWRRVMRDVAMSFPSAAATIIVANCASDGRPALCRSLRSPPCRRNFAARCLLTLLTIFAQHVYGAYTLPRPPHLLRDAIAPCGQPALPSRRFRAVSDTYRQYRRAVRASR
jgi:hypothetical protein